MKSKLLVLLVLAIGVLTVGCGKKDTTIDWIIDMTNTKQTLNERAKQAFDNAKSNYSGKLDYVALLAKQVVAGTNYMFLCKDDNSYKVAIVYNNLEGVSQITQVNEFNPVKYVNERFELDNEQLVGGWSVEIPEEKMELPNDIQNYFNKATSTLTGATYYPVAVLAHQEKSGTNYAILCFGEGSYQGSTAGIYLLTLYVDKTDKPEIVSIAAVDIKEYNK